MNRLDTLLMEPLGRELMTNRTPVVAVASVRGRQCPRSDQVLSPDLPHHPTDQQRCLTNNCSNNEFQCLFILDVRSF